MKQLLYLLAVVVGTAQAETLIFHDSECAFHLSTGDVWPAAGFDSVCKVEGKELSCRYAAQDGSTTSTGRLMDPRTENPSRIRVLVSPDAAEQITLNADGSYLWWSGNNVNVKICEGFWSATQ
jgi:hypothetical protein